MRGWDAFVETQVPEHELIVSRTNLQGIITYANATFAQVSGYAPEELVGKPHNIVRHPDMPRSVFTSLWESLKREEMWEGIVKNLRKDGGFYWVYAEVSGVYKEGKLVEYKSMRFPITPEQKRQAQQAYEILKAKEEGECFASFYLPCALLEKLEKYAAQTQQKESQALAKLLDERLL